MPIALRDGGRFVEKEMQTKASTLSPSLLTRREAAAFLSVSERKLDQLVAAGQIPRAKIGASVRILRADLDKFIEERKSA